MATSAPSAQRARRVIRKTITFDGGTGSGATGTFAFLTTTGTVFVYMLNIHCVTGLTSSGGTISLGISGETAGLIALTTASDIDTGEQWTSNLPEKIGDPIMNIILSDSVIATIATADITGGVLEIEVIFDALSADGMMS